MDLQCKKESGNNPNAKAKTSSASGLFQFTEGTWKELNNKYKLSTIKCIRHKFVKYTILHCIGRNSANSDAMIAWKTLVDSK